MCLTGRICGKCVGEYERHVLKCGKLSRQGLWEISG